MLLDRLKLLALSVSFACGGASATVAYDTLGPTNGYLTGAWIVGNLGGSTPSGFNYVSADSITLSSSGYLSFITAPLTLLPDSVASPIQFDIRADNGGIPGTTLATAFVPIVQTDGNGALYTATFSGNTFLTSSTPYWLTLSATYAGTAAVWQMNALGIRTTHVFTGAAWQQPGQWFINPNQFNGAARIELLSPVPEVSEAMLLLLGGPLLLAAVRLRRRA